MLTATGLLTRTAIAGTYGALLFLLADAFGMFSFVRLFGLASAEGRKRLLSRTLVGKLDPGVASAAAEMLIGSALRAGIIAQEGATGQPPARPAAAVMGQASRYLAWLASTSLVLSTRQVASAGAARELVALSVRVRDRILRLADPDPL